MGSRTSRRVGEKLSKIKLTVRKQDKRSSFRSNITDLKIEIIYDGNNVRPNAFNIKYKKNGRVIKVPTIYN